MMSRRFLATNRSVFVGKGSTDAAYKVLTSIMRNTGLVSKIARRRFYEKPTEKRERLEYEKCNRLYNKEMKRKIEFLMKQHDPLPPQ
jgi:small subunit ribosomal protein S21